MGLENLISNGNGYIGDVPQRIEHAVTAPDNIGSGWPPSTHTEYHRLRGIYPSYINTDILRIELQQAIVQAQENLLEQVTRFTIKAFVSREQLEVMIQDHREVIEAVVPLGGTQDRFSDGYYVYFGENHQSRRGNQDINYARKVVNTLTNSVEQIKPSEYLERTTNEGEFLYVKDSEKFTVSLLSEDECKTDKVIREMEELYKPFGYDRQSVMNLLADRSNIIAVAKNGDRIIISTSLIQKVEMKIDNEAFVMGEITEAATHKDYTKKGLYRAVSSALILLSEDLDLLIGECNTYPHSLGVLKTAVSQGRGISVKISEDLGLQAGVLRASVPIADPGESPDELDYVYNNLAVTFLTREELNKFKSNFNDYKQ